MHSLAPGIQTYLTALDAFDQAAGPHTTLSQQRDHFVAKCQHFETAPWPAGVTTQDAALPARTGPIRVRFYRPGLGPRPAIVYAHGGGWVLGDLASHHAFCADLAAATGAVVVAVDYRLAPEHRYPAAFDDMHGVVAHLQTSGARWGLVPGRLAVAGDSAGGNLAAACAVAQRDRGGMALRGQALIYPCLRPALDTTSCRQLADGPGLTRAAMVAFWDAYLGDTSCRDPLGGTSCRDPYAAPPFARSWEGVCPAFIAVAELDLLRDDGCLYAEQLHAARVPVQRSVGAGLVHGYLRARHLSPTAAAEVDKVAGWLRGVLG